MDGREKMRQTLQTFQAHFSSQGYLPCDSVPISSGVDPTVRLIGSHISVLKPLFLPGAVLEEPCWIIQPCIRTHALKSIFDDSRSSRWGSYFVSMGALHPASELVLACRDLHQYLGRLGLKNEKILIRVSSTDADFVSACREGFPGVEHETDTRPAPYYRHAIGVEGVTGRNFNIAIADANTTTFEDIGNIIVFETGGQEIGIETALGASVLTVHLHGLEHVLDCHSVPGLSHEPAILSRKLQDAIINATVLWREGLRPNGSENRGRVLRTYLRALLYLCARLDISQDQLLGLIEDFEEAEFSAHGTGSEILAYLDIYLAELSRRGPAGREDEIVLQTLMRTPVG